MSGHLVHPSKPGRTCTVCVCVFFFNACLVLTIFFPCSSVYHTHTISADGFFPPVYVASDGLFETPFFHFGVESRSSDVFRLFSLSVYTVMVPLCECRCICASRYEWHHSGNRLYLLHLPPLTIMNPIYAKRFHGTICYRKREKKTHIQRKKKICEGDCFSDVVA